jgi:hypothetical protein
MKILLIVSALILVLGVKASADDIKAKVVSKSATLYQKPYECAKKKRGYFKEGDIIPIIYCNQYRWCKTKHGYVKKDLLKISGEKKEPAKREIESKKIVKRSETDMKTIRLIPYNKIHKRVRHLTPYEEYFRPSSVKVWEGNNSL